MRLLVCGGREFMDVEYAIPRLQRIHEKTPISTLICGMADGGDSIAHAWAKELGIPIDEYPADWKKHGRAAGPIRNKQMRDEGHPDLVVGLPGGTGTAGMLKLAREGGIPAVEYRYNYFQKEDPVWGFLSNFYPREFEEIGTGIRYQSNEHYYQAAKTLDQEWQQKIIDADTAGKAKKLGNAKELPLRKDWNTYKLVAMMAGLRLKFNGQPEDEITTRLLHTGDDYLVEYAPWGDTFWGVDKEKKGLNWLGRLLMRRRDEILSGRVLY